MIELNENECQILRSVLENDVSDLRTEIAHTDAQDFREALKHREAVLKGLLARLASHPVA